ncbi:MAG TPA: DUF6691 family protein [Polyangiaceae bacterium]|nr:DUF6691 family protein [Polyangiaceae bacterium]
MSSRRPSGLSGPLVSLSSGLLLGIGLWLSGMTSPAKVQGFLDVAGAWDPTLAFVMGAAVLTCAAFSWVAGRRGAPVLDARFPPLESRTIDGRLITGAAVFGVGWGLCGVCPGPGIVSLGTAGAWPLVFVAAMALGARAENALSLHIPQLAGRHVD